MVMERKGWAVQFRLGQPAMGGTLISEPRATAFHELHEPDDGRQSRPESVSAQGEILWIDSAAVENSRA